jgi:hypothetical protein
LIYDEICLDKRVLAAIMIDKAVNTADAASTDGITAN